MFFASSVIKVLFSETVFTFITTLLVLSAEWFELKGLLPGKNYKLHRGVFNNLEVMLYLVQNVKFMKNVQTPKGVVVILKLKI